MRYRVALCGFSQFEHRAIQFSFEHPSQAHRAACEVVDVLDDADFAVVDADSASAVDGVVQAGKLARAVFIGGAPPDGAAAHLRRPIDPQRILRLFDELTTQSPLGSDDLATFVAAFARPEPDSLLAAELVFPSLDGAGEGPASQASSVAPPQASSAAPPQASAPPAAPPYGARSTDTPKGRARAKARRARLAGEGGATAGEALRDVLVLDADEAANVALSILLERFGFTVHSVDSVAAAQAQLGVRPYAAIFLDIALDGGDRGAGLALLDHIHYLAPVAPHAAAAVMLVTQALNPADRVRASLAGLGPAIDKPVSRGSLARALEARDVTLPRDARQA